MTDADKYETKLSVIIPSLDGDRGGNVARLKAQLAEQTLKPCEVIVIVGVSPNGRARNQGAEKASGKYLVFIDDDVTLGHERVLENLIRPFSEHDNIGLTGPSQLIPEDSSWWQRVAARQVPRTVFPVQEGLVDSDMVTHMCLCIPSELFREIGGENPDIIAGTDPDLRFRVRQAGFRVCVVPETWAYHPLPETFMGFLRQAWYKGVNSAKVRKSHPELVLELDAGYRKNFKARRSFPYRLTRQLGYMFLGLFTFRWMLLLVMIIYSLGNLRESIKR